MTSVAGGGLVHTEVKVGGRSERQSIIWTTKKKAMHNDIRFEELEQRRKILGTDIQYQPQSAWL